MAHWVLNRKKYEAAYGKLWDKILNETVAEVIENSPSKTSEIKVSTEYPGAFPDFTLKKRGG